MSLTAQVGILCAGLLLLVGMLTGVWKFVEMRRSEAARAPLYVDIAHRASLLYAAATLVLAALAELSRFPEWLNLAAVLTNVAFFSFAIGTYVVHGVSRRRETQYTERNFTTGIGTWALAVAEVGSTALLLVGATWGVLGG